jgi:hypothetical protein
MVGFSYCVPHLIFLALWGTLEHRGRKPIAERARLQKNEMALYRDTTWPRLGIEKDYIERTVC